MAIFGSNTFEGLSVPLVFGGRYFIIEDGDPTLVSVLALHEGRFEIEVLRNEPQATPTASVSKSAAGIVTVSTPGAGFIYKVRPDSETSVTFGRIPDGRQLEARVTDKFVKIVRHLDDGTTQDVMTASRNQFGPNMAGIIVGEDGSIGMGAAIPPGIAMPFGGP